MTTANVHQAKSNLSKLLNAAADGDDVVITRRGGKITQFKLVPIDICRARRMAGRMGGDRITIKNLTVVKVRQREK